MKREVLCGVLLLSLLAGCIPPPRPPKTVMELREIQTREFATRDTKRVMKAVLDTLQDDGFITKNAVMDLGLITATKEMDVASPRDEYLARFFDGRRAEWPKNELVEVNVNITELSRRTKVRVSFQRKVVTNHGDPVVIETVESPEYYQRFFSKVDKGIFLEGEGL